MKTYNKVMSLVGVLLLIGVAFSSAQTVGTFRTHSQLQNGNWSSTSSWDRYDGSTWVNPAPNAPTGSETIYILGSDSVSVDVAVTITGTLIDSGKINTSATLTIGNGGTYNHASNGGKIPIATWSTGSTCLITGITANSPSNGNQSFYNLTWNCPAQTGNLNLGWTADTIRGTIRCVSTGTGRFYFTNNVAFAAPIVLLGDVIVQGGTLSTNGSSSVGTVNPIVVKSYGKIIVTGGNFGCSRGSAPSVSWNVFGDTMAVSNATLQNSSSTPTAIQKFIFAKAGTQVLAIGSGVTYGTATSPINMEVDSGTTLNIGSSVISSSNSGGFILRGGATVLSTGGSIQPSSTSAASIGTTYVTSKHITGTGSLSVTAHEATHPNSPNASKSIKRYWTIAATGGITVDTLQFFYLSSDIQGTEANYVPMRYEGTGTSWALGSGTTSVNTTLHFVNAFAPTTLAADWTVGESSLTGVEKKSADDVPLTFYVKQNYPNPFNPSTNITYGVPKESFVSVKVYNILGQEIATIFEGHQNAGVHTFSFNGAELASGVYLYRVQAGNSVETRRMVLMK